MEKVGKIFDRVVLDTDCLVQLEKGDISIIEFLDRSGILFITSISVFEFALGELFNEKDTRLEDYIVIPFNKQDGLLAAKMFKKLRKSGMELEFRDVMIASICINNKIPLLTRNKKHFERFKEDGLILVG